MIDYTNLIDKVNIPELVKALRYHVNPDVEDCDECPYRSFRDMYGKCTDMMIANAADAIEALQAEVERLKDSNEELREKQTYIDHYGTEWLTSAKDVPNYAYEHGYADGVAEIKAQLPKRGEWIWIDKHTVQCPLCHRYLDLRGVNAGRGDANYCPNCGVKMEAQE